MRNLNVVAYEEARDLRDLPLTSSAWDLNDESLVCTFGPTPEKPVIELARKSAVGNAFAENHDQTSGIQTIATWDAPCPLPELDCDRLILTQHFAHAAMTCIVLAGGDLVLIRQQPQTGEETIELVGSIDAGIAAAAWAPDEQVLAIVTRDDNLVLMSRQLEPLTETKLEASDLQASRHVSVGWGKKETQFQGKRAKAMRDPTMPERVDQGLTSPLDDGSTSISWRGDGAYLAVNALVPDHRRAIRVFSREGKLDSTSEPVDGLESALSWRPSGNLIASIQRSRWGTDDEQLDVIFFERNGLRHGEFPLCSHRTEMNSTSSIKLSWNVDSTVLAVSLPDSVQFWTMGNYHYYLKQEIQVTKDTASILQLRWHNENPLKCCIASSVSILDIQFDRQVCRGSMIPPHDHGVVAVVDGRNLKLTPLRYAVVPPPMAFCETSAQYKVKCTSISPSGQIIAVLTSTTLELYRWTPWTSATTADHSKERNAKSISKLHMSLEEIHTVPYISVGQLAFQDNDKLYLLLPRQGQCSAKCFCLTLADQAIQEWTRETVIVEVSAINVADKAQAFVTDTKKEHIWTKEPGDDRLMCLTSASSSMTLKGTGPNPMIFSSRAYGQDYDRYHTVALSTTGVLTADNHILARDCTSFALTDTYLVLTTSQHLLQFAHLAQPQDMQVLDDVSATNERCRSIERGAMIVTVVPSIYAVILQMPRGNLETVYPRALVLAGIRRNLQNHQYRTAFLACQTHQVDMNLICDHLPEEFMANMNKFVDELRKPSRVDEFISKLKEEDVTETLYKETFRTMSRPELFSHPDQAGKVMPKPAVARRPGADKVNRVCNALIALLNTKSTKYLQNIITAHICKRPPDFVAALTLVSSLRENSPDDADVAIAHLCFLTDSNRLYDAALGLYDLELTLLVAQNAQKDPREYMPFLQNLHSLSPLRRQFEIDDHLRNYSKALISLHSLKAHAEVEAYLVKHSLYTSALSLYQYDAERLPHITILYAQYLESRSLNAAAAALYESLEHYDLAYPLYALAHQWREALTCAALVPLEPEKLRSLALSLSHTLAEETRDYRAAATIYIDYLADIPTAARLLCKGSYFAEATRILASKGLASTTSTIIDPALTEKFGEIIELISECKSQILVQVPRILELRVKKAEDPLAFYGGDASMALADGIEIPDNVSIAGSDASTAGGQSLFTRYGSNASKFGGTVASNLSHKTSKTKRKEERKRARGKKGSVYEEEYLVGSTARLIDRVNAVQDEVRRLISGLIRRRLREQAAKIDEAMLEITAACRKARKEVWHLQDEVVPTGQDIDGGNGGGNDTSKLPGADGVLWDAQQGHGAESHKRAPEVKEWKADLLWLR